LASGDSQNAKNRHDYIQFASESARQTFQPGYRQLY